MTIAEEMQVLLLEIQVIITKIKEEKEVLDDTICVLEYDALHHRKDITALRVALTALKAENAALKRKVTHPIRRIRI